MNAAVSARLSRTVRELLRLAWPVVIARAGILMMAFADIVMVGRYATAELAYAALGVSLFVPIIVTGIGLQIGVGAIAARQFGAGNLHECGRVWRRAMPWAVCVGLVGFVTCLFGETFLTLIGQKPQLATNGGAVAHALAPGVPAQIIYVACAFYLEGTKRPLPGMIAMLLGNLLNIALNWVLIYGAFGLPAYGAVGAAAATSVVRIALAVGLIVYILTRSNAREYGIFTPAKGFWGPGGWRAGIEMRRLGMAAGAAVFFETISFAVLAQFAGILGEEDLAAYSVAHNVEAIAFMIALGVASATGVLVANAYGRGDRSDAVMAGWCGVGLSLALSLTFGLLLLIFRTEVAALYSSDAALNLVIAALFLIVCLNLIPDGLQIVLGQSVRALADSWMPTFFYLVAFGFIMTPLAWILAFELELGVKGLFLATLVGCLVSTLLQGMRFVYLCNRRFAA